MEEIIHIMAKSRQKADDISCKDILDPKNKKKACKPNNKVKYTMCHAGRARKKGMSKSEALKRGYKAIKNLCPV